MSDNSPLFVSALELLAHATELYASGHPRKYKFVILHLANSIELLLKDCLIDHGVSIYKNPKETVTIWGCFDELGKLGIHVAEKPVIELLVDDRNTIQHRFGFPDAESVYYYLEQVVGFFKNFLSSQYNLDLAETLKPHITEQQLEMLGLVENEYSYLPKLMKISPQAAVVQAYKLIEEKILGFISPYLSTLRNVPDPMFWRKPIFSQFLQDLEQHEYISEGMLSRFQTLRSARNYAAHVTSGDDFTVDWQTVFMTAEELINGLQKAEQEGYKFVLSQSIPDPS